MDNNFINIDDLVRQRLSGAAEPERSGSWMRMQELLDKEEKRKPAGIYWKRAMSYCGVAMLLAAVSVGGYELNTSFRIPSVKNAQGNAAADGPVAAVSNVASTDDANSDAVASGNISRPAGTGSAVSSTATKTKVISYTVPANTTKVPRQEASIAVVTGAHTSPAVPNTVSSLENGVAPSGTPAKVAATAAVTTNVTTIKNNITDKHNTVNASRVPATGAVEHNINTAKNNTANTQGKVSVTSNDIAAVSYGSGKPVNTGSVVVRDATNTGTNIATPSGTRNNDNIQVAKNEKTATNRPESLPLGAGTSFAKAPIAEAKTPSKHTEANAATAGNKPSVAGNNKKVGIVTGKTGVNNKIVAAVPVVKHDPIPVKPIEGKKVIERIVMHQTVTNVYAGRIETKLDTISIDEVTLALKQAREKREADKAAALAASVAAEQEKNVAKHAKTNSAVAANTPAKPGNKLLGNTAAKPSATPAVSNYNSSSSNNNSTATNNTGAAQAATPDNTIVAAQPAAAPSSADADAMAAVVTPQAAQPASVTPPAAPPVAGKKKHTSNMAASLSSMFNEVKFKFGNAQFAPGITAGINGTFFGPNSFKGFQFGFTGAFEFDEKWSFMGELKYFHRVNNDYSLFDHYNQYTAAPGGFYKDSTERSFSFSTLHSFELPLSLRYTAGRFSFFAGGNFLYTLGVNTGHADNYVDYSNRPIVSTAGNNSAPTVRDEDFSARFGVGYLFGLSCKVTPNLTFDFRNVRTAWDNAKSDGSKTVSDQLYKSPSLQFSLFYRIGKGSSESKDQ